MTVAVAASNVVAGLAYLFGFGLLPLLDLRRHRSRAFAQFGLALALMGFTCGPHHFDHGLHTWLGDRPGGGLDLVAILVAIPPSVLFLLLRIEALGGGRGDRRIEGTPPWLVALAVAVGVYATVMVAGSMVIVGRTPDWNAMSLPNLLLVGVFGAVGLVLLQAQLHQRRVTGAWSVSGLSLIGLFLTCAATHGTWVVYAAADAYESDVHGLLFGWLAVPAGLYFLWVVAHLRREQVQWYQPPPPGEGELGVATP